MLVVEGFLFEHQANRFDGVGVGYIAAFFEARVGIRVGVAAQAHNDVSDHSLPSATGLWILVGQLLE